MNLTTRFLAVGCPFDCALKGGHYLILASSSSLEAAHPLYPACLTGSCLLRRDHTFADPCSTYLAFDPIYLWHSLPSFCVVQVAAQRAPDSYFPPALCLDCSGHSRHWPSASICVTRYVATPSTELSTSPGCSNTRSSLSRLVMRRCCCLHTRTCSATRRTILSADLNRCRRTSEETARRPWSLMKIAAVRHR